MIVCLALQRCDRRQTQLLPALQTCLYRFFCCVSLSTFFTIFCSSIRNALTIRSFTQFEHRDPPYARWTVFFGREIVAYSRGRRAGICNSKPALFSRAHTGVPNQEIARCESLEGRTDTWELDSAITTFWWAALLLNVLVSQFPTWSLDDADFVGASRISVSRHSIISIQFRRVARSSSCARGGKSRLTGCFDAVRNTLSNHILSQK